MNNISEKQNSTRAKTFILWIAALILTYLAGYIHSIINPNFPISGTIGIEGEKVTYKFDKVIHSNEPYKVYIRTDLSGLTGFVEHKKLMSKDGWKKEELIALTSGYQAELDALAPNDIYYYKVFLFNGDEKIQLPANTILSLKYLGAVPIAVSIIYYFLIYAGLVFTLRVGLEYFSGRNNHKKLLLSGSIFYFLFSFVTAPVYRLFELGLYGDSKAGLAQIFLFKDLFFFLITLFGFLAIFNAEKSKLVGLIYSIIVITFFIFFYH